MDRKNLFPLSHPQRRIWYSEKLHPGTSMWNNAGTLKIKGKLDVPLMEKAILAFIENSEAIRLRITEVNGVPYQYCAPFFRKKIDVLDFSATGLRQLFEWDNAQTLAPMSILDAPLYYFAIVRLAGGKGAIYAKVHHIISDALSMVELSDRILENYRALLSGEEPAPGPPGSYADFVRSEREYIESKRFLYDKQYWNQRFFALSEPTVLKEKKDNYFSTRARRKTFVLTARLTGQIRDHCLQTDMSVFSFFLSALSTYIFRVTGRRDLIVSAPVANRTAPEFKNALGMFVSIVPIRIEIDENLPFAQFAQAVSNEWFSVLKHQKYPYNMLLQDLRKTHEGLDSLYEITLSYQNAVFSQNTRAFVDEGRWHFSGHQLTSLNIHINDREGDGRFIIDYDHLVPLFSLKEIEYIHEHLMCIIQDVLLHPEKPLAQVNILMPEERSRILNVFNDTGTVFPRDESLLDLWSAQVARTPSLTAVVSADGALTYAELDARAGAVAAKLHALGLGREDVVGVMLGRTLDLFIGLIGVIKAGCAFLPIATELPADRVEYMLTDASARALLLSDTVGDCCGGLGIPVVRAEAFGALQGKAPRVRNKPGDLAYVIYTSGSTGQPKGVAIEQHSIVHFLYSLHSIMDFTPGNRVLCAAAISFDLFIMECLPTLTAGGTVVLAAERDTAIPRNLIQLIEKHKANKLLFTPSRMDLLLSDERALSYLPSVREIMLGGDVLPVRLLKRLQACTGARILNFYGPTEITIAATYKDVTEAKTVNIGKPMPNVRAYILDAHRNLVPIGVYGELYIGGRGLARGYINSPELNAASFVDDPFVPGEKIYRTGDMARWYPMGDIEYLGRMDQQVKIRGFRIELGEIESRLSQVPGVRSCAVVDRVDDDGRKYLCAYIVGEALPSRSQIIAALSRDLPAYMVPSYFVILDELPLNFSGKLDKKQLPDPLKHTITALADEFEPPQTSTEKVLASIWSRILKVHPIGRNESFFDIGGDSLSIIAAMGEVEQVYHVDISLEEVYRAPTLKACAAYIDSAEQHGFRPIALAPVRRHYPASPAQKRMYVLSMGAQGSTAYNIPVALQLTGPLSLPLLEKAFIQLIRRHDALRTAFVLRSGALCQYIRKNVDFRLGFISCSPSRLQATLKSLNEPFDLSTAPLMRATVICTRPDRHILHINIHHSVCDGRSMEILLEELAMLYGREIPLSKDLDYKDYTMWHLGFLECEEGKRQGAFWKELLSAPLPLLNLQTDFPRGAAQTFTGTRLRFAVQKDLLERLRACAHEHNVTLFMLLLAAYNVFLHKYTGQEDFIVGVPVAGRARDELRNMVGMFVNTLPLRNRPQGDADFTAFLQSVRDNCLAAYQNSDYPLDMMVAALSPERTMSRNPFFDTMISYQSASVLSIQMQDLKVKPYPVDPGTAKLDLTLEIYDQGTALNCELEYNTALFKKQTVARMAGHFLNLLQALADAPHTRIRNLSILSDAERAALTGLSSPHPLDLDTEVYTLFARRAAAHPDKPAIVMEGRVLTFAQLERRANDIAAALAERGIKRGDTVALCLHRSFDLVAGILGIWKAGAAYLPIDPEYPADRIKFILSDSGAAALLTDGWTGRDFAGAVLHTGAVPGGAAPVQTPKGTPQDIAYVIYTSGSTGQPKGVALTRGALINLYESTKPVIGYLPEDVCVAITTVAFDIFIADTLLPLFFGCTVALSTEEELRQPHLLARLITAQKADFIQATPTRMRLMMNDSSFRKAVARIRTILLGGEPVPLSLLKLLKRHTAARIINGYGPSEATVYTTFKDLTASARVSIGRPVYNTRFYVLDSYQNPLPVGVPGEGYVSGICVGTGYIHRETLTAEKFLPDPFAPGQTMYRTGDLCMLNAAGDYEMLGRLDYQVKLHGLRIELEEIEACMRAYPDVHEAVVKDFGANADKYLCGYFTASQAVEIPMLRHHLEQKLPAYMVPSFLIPLDAMPLTPNGKIDRKALREPARENARQTAANNRPVRLTPRERTMRRIWSRILGVKNIGPEDSFFALGGTSLDVIRVQAAALQYNWAIRTQDFYDLQTLRAICAAMDSAAPAAVPEPNRDLESLRNVPIKAPETPLKPVPLQKVLLTGVTGFLGAHILHELINGHDAAVYCLVRDPRHVASRRRLKQTLSFYFGDEQAAGLMQRLRVVQGDITAQNLGIAPKDLETLCPGITAVIHCAALTSHIGHAELFSKVNVGGTANVTAFCEKAGASLLHISTVSVSGARFAGEETRSGTFTEENYYIGQDYTDNEYRRSKFLAEGLVLDAIERGLDARIFRIGNLTGRFSDAKYQINPEANAFAQRVRMFSAIGCVPIGALSGTLEMTPVDVCAKAVLTLATASGACQRVYHVYNPYPLTVSALVDAMRAEGFKVDTVSDESFSALLTELSKKGEYNSITGLVDFAPAVQASGIRPQCAKTQEQLVKEGFAWPRPNLEYVRSFVRSLHRQN